VDPSRGQTISESYVFDNLRIPFRILLGADVIARLESEIARSGARETGGLLIRKKRSDPSVVKIFDIIPAAGASKDGRFRFPPDFLAEAIARCPSDSKIAGFYRTDLEPGIRLRAEDQEPIRQWFTDPQSIFLVISTAPDHKPRAGFFGWENQSVSAEPLVVFPLSNEKLMGAGWPSLRDVGGRTGLFRWPARSLSGLTSAIRHASTKALIGTAAVVVALAIGVRVLVWNYAPRRPPAASNLGLQVELVGPNFLVSWNPSHPEIARAKDANLVVWEGDSDTAGEPAVLTLRETQLHQGSFVYHPTSLGSRVRFRLDIIDGSGNSTAESLVWVAPDLGDIPPLPQPEPQPKPPPAKRSTNKRAHRR